MGFDNSFNDNVEDYTGVADQWDKDAKDEREFNDTFTHLPLLAYTQNFKFLDNQEVFKQAFHSVKVCVDAGRFRKAADFAKKIDIRNRDIPEEKASMLIGETTSISVALDTLGFYYYGNSPRPEYTKFKCEWLCRLEYNSGPQIIIDSKKIISKENDTQKQAFLMAVVVLHELMHAVLDPKNDGKNDEMPHNLLYRHMKEEAWANALTLMAIKSAGLNDLLEYALGFMKTQPKECGYQYGIKLFNDNANWEEWIEEKAGWSCNDLKTEKHFIKKVKNYKSHLSFKNGEKSSVCTVAFNVPINFGG